MVTKLLKDTVKVDCREFSQLEDSIKSSLFSILGSTVTLRWCISIDNNILGLVISTRWLKWDNLKVGIRISFSSAIDYHTFLDSIFPLLEEKCIEGLSSPSEEEVLTWYTLHDIASIDNLSYGQAYYRYIDRRNLVQKPISIKYKGKWRINPK
jgi:hypothetical protein